MNPFRSGAVTAISSVVICLGIFATLNCAATLAQSVDVNNPWPKDPYLANNRQPDERFKTDVLVVVAHPDDEIMAAAYIARLVDEGKRVALVWTTRGDGGTNDAGPEQAAAMGDIREVEALRAAEFLGITNMWDLGGPDTPSQDPLESLETCNHGRCLDRLVRIVRLTRPAVILTWLPLGVTGENHGDHQASGVMATEAFDMAGDPTAFSEQITPVREPSQNMNRLEGLRPWQPQKIYYFSNPTHMEFFSGHGPEYPTTDLSPARHLTYGQIAAEEFAIHRTQGGGRLEQALRDKGIEALKSGPIPLTTPTQFILGKSLVPCGVTDDVFTGIVPAGIPFRRAPGYAAPEISAPTIEIGGAWHFYKEWWQAHGIEHLAKLIPAEVTIPVGGSLSIPLIIDNPLDKTINVTFQVHSPDGWTVSPVTDTAVNAQTQYFLRVQAGAPKLKPAGWQQFTVNAQADGKSLGTVSLRIELANWALPQ
jgi:LmbE family N-acetylglucosaminyl deacetylase